jgi:hypothetical protein
MPWVKIAMQIDTFYFFVAVNISIFTYSDRATIKNLAILPRVKTPGLLILKPYRHFAVINA